jgi:2,3-bisphosphoglycerate-independent phosphoglycerate mutase
VVDAAVARGGVAIVLADHGNAELMIDPATGGPHTAHTTNLVPCYLVAPEGSGLGKGQVELREGGKLADIAPTVCDLLGIAPAPQMTGQSLLIRRAAAAAQPSA